MKSLVYKKMVKTWKVALQMSLVLSAPSYLPKKNLQKKFPLDIWREDSHYTGSEPGTFQNTSQNLYHFSYLLFVVDCYKKRTLHYILCHGQFSRFAPVVGHYRKLIT
jgi:hypothetical protein